MNDVAEVRTMLGEHLFGMLQRDVALQRFFAKENLEVAAGGDTGKYVRVTRGGKSVCAVSELRHLEAYLDVRCVRLSKSCVNGISERDAIAAHGLIENIGAEECCRRLQAYANRLLEKAGAGRSQPPLQCDALTVAFSFLPVDVLKSILQVPLFVTLSGGTGFLEVARRWAEPREVIRFSEGSLITQLFSLELEPTLAAMCLAELAQIGDQTELLADDTVQNTSLIHEVASRALRRVTIEALSSARKEAYGAAR